MIPESPSQVERMAARLLVMVSDADRLAHRLQTRQWTETQLEDLRAASALLAQAQRLLRRHARRWRGDHCPTCESRWRVSMRQRGAPCPDPWHYGAEKDS